MDVAKVRSENLSEEVVTRRLRAGVLILLVSLGMVVYFDAIEASPWMRMVLFVPFLLSSFAFFQAIHKTCGLSAMRGVRHTPDGLEPIADSQALSACRTRGRIQLISSVLAALAMTSVFAWL